MDADSTAWEERSVVSIVPPVQPRKLAKVPFVELADGRLQGVVSSGSDVSRVYVSSITAGTHAFNCSTNNNRPCGGAGGGFMCNHLRALLDEAVVQYGDERVIRYLRIDAPERVNSGYELVRFMHGSLERTPASIVFSRFLRHLAYLELPASTEPIPELHWFPATRAAH